ncbi:hypothetical protein DZD52_08905 [Xanthomonas nasturtii]|uniref:Uncharacterized protein n=1 Tax=Xanthomonas nasturtii TaxID=1843581 RepID=A0A3E1KLK1_9XANT|nr:hypothetical protein DZD52_08905 [Xanthomonas nasturtii]
MAKSRPNASVGAFSPTAPCAGQLHGSIAGHALARRQPHTAGLRQALLHDACVRARPAPPLLPLRWPGAQLPGAAHDRQADDAAARPG